MKARTSIILSLWTSLFVMISCGTQKGDAETGVDQETSQISQYKRYTRETLPDSLVVTIESIRDRARESGDYGTYGLSALILANRSVHAQDYQAAIFQMEDYIGGVTTAADDSAALVQAYYRMGAFYYDNGIAWLALDNFLKAADYAITDRKRSRILYAIGISSSNSHEASRGIRPSEYFSQAEDLARQQGDSVMVAMSLFGRASGYLDFLGVHKFRDELLTYSRRDSIDTAITLLGEAEKYEGSMDVIHYALGLSHAALKDFHRARDYIYRDTLGNRPVTTQGLNVRASLAICMGHYAEALTYADAAYRRAESTRNEGDMRNSLHIMYYIHKYSGNAAKALETFERFGELRQRLMDESFEQQVNISQVRYDTKLKEEKLVSAERENKLYRRGMMIIACAFLIVVILLTTIVFYYRKTRKAHKALVEKSLQWARNPNSMERVKEIDSPNGKPDHEQRAMTEKASELLTTNKLYLKPDLTINEVADLLETNRTYLSEAINRVYGNSFTIYVNEFRVKEAVNLISHNENDKYTVDILAKMSGFSNRKTFHSAFVRATGLTPSEFRRNRGSAGINPDK